MPTQRELEQAVPDGVEMLNRAREFIAAASSIRSHPLRNTHANDVPVLMAQFASTQLRALLRALDAAPEEASLSVAAERFADEVAALIRVGKLGSRSRVGDALLDYRNPPWTERSDAIAEEIRAAQVAAPEVGDTERLDWLARNLGRAYPDAAAGDGHPRILYSRTSDLDDPEEVYDGDTLREAIDAARAAEREGEGGSE